MLYSENLFAGATCSYDANTEISNEQYSKKADTEIFCREWPRMERWNVVENGKWLHFLPANDENANAVTVNKL